MYIYKESFAAIVCSYYSVVYSRKIREMADVLNDLFPAIVEGDEEVGEVTPEPVEGEGPEGSPPATETPENGGTVAIEGQQTTTTGMEDDDFGFEDIPREKDQGAWELPAKLVTFLEKYARSHVPDSDVSAWMEDYPPPANVNLIPDLDQAVRRALKEEGKNATVDADDDFSQIQKKIQDVMGPLGVAWFSLHNFNKGLFPEMDNTCLLDQLRKSLILVAHAIQRISYYRRVHVLGAVGKVKDAREVLKRDNVQSIFQKNSSGELFSKEFFDIIKTEKSSKSTIVDIFKPSKTSASNSKKKDAGKTKSASNSGGKFIPTGSKRPFPANPSPRQGGGSSSSKNGPPYNNPFNKNYKDSYRGKFRNFLHGQHALNSIMASESATRTQRNTGDFSSHTRDLPSGRKDPKIPSQLEGSHDRPICVEHCEGMAGPVDLGPKSKENSSRNKDEQNRGGGHGFGGGEHVDQGSYQEGYPKTGPVLKQRFCHPKRGGPVPADNKPEGVEQVCPLPSFQNGGSEGGQTPSEKRGLDVQDGPKRRILLGSPAPRIPKICQISVERSSVRVPLSGFWPGASPADLYKTDEGSHFPPQKIGGMSSHISRRPPHNGVLQGGAPRGQGYNPVPVPSLGVNHKHEKVGSGSVSSDGISRSVGKQPESDLFPPGEEDSEIDFKMSGSVKPGRDNFTESLFPVRDVESDSPGCLSSAPTNTLPATVEHPGSGGETSLRLKHLVITRRKVGTEVVDRKFGNPQRETDKSSSPTTDDLLRRSSNRGMGGGLPSGLYRGPVESRGEVVQHKLTGAHSSGASHKNFHQRVETVFNSHENRQHLGPLIPFENGRNEELGHVGGGQENMGISLGTPDHNYCRMDPLPLEYGSGLGVKKRTGFLGVETLPKNFSHDLSAVGESRGGPLRLKDFTPAGQVRQLETRPVLRGSGCVLPRLGPALSIRVPTILSHNKGFTPDGRPKGEQNVNHRPNLANTTLVPSNPVHVGRYSSSTTTKPAIAVKSSGTGTPFTGGPLVFSGGMVGIRDRHQTEGISAEASKIMLHARRRGSIQTYESAWKKWVLWCGERGVDPFKCPVRHCLDYLAHLFQSGRPYRTIGVHRSTISAYHDPIVVGSAVIPVGKHPNISTLMSGIHNLRPPTAKYSFTWDVEMVLGLFRSWAAPLDPKKLTMKTVTLLGLIGVSRGAELHLFDLNFLGNYGDHISFELPGTVKNGKEGIKPKPVKYYKHLEDLRLCPYSCIEQYTTLSAPWRQDGKPSKFFLSFKAPHKPVSKSTLARWIKDTLLLADVDTKTFQAHSLRGASTSKAFLKGLSVREVLDHGRWSRESTWQRFYHRPVDSTSKRYQDQVLG